MAILGQINTPPISYLPNSIFGVGVYDIIANVLVKVYDYKFIITKAVTPWNFHNQ